MRELDLDKTAAEPEPIVVGTLESAAPTLSVLVVDGGSPVDLTGCEVEFRSGAVSSPCETVGPLAGFAMPAGHGARGFVRVRFPDGVVATTQSVRIGEQR